MNRLVIVAIFLAIAVNGISVIEKNKNSLKLSLFYESYCPYSIQFFNEQLYKTWGQFKSHIKLDLVPFGNAQQTYNHGHFHFTCQHGPKECVGNILHSCAIYQGCGKKGTLHCPMSRLRKVMNYLYCVFQQPDQKQASNKCAIKARLNPGRINKCSGSKLGEWLESRYGNQTRAFKPAIQYVPFIAINNKHTEIMQELAQSNLKALICKYIPKLCRHHRSFQDVYYTLNDL